MSLTNLPTLGRARLSSLAGDELRARIVRGVWKPGERRPSERQLGEQLGRSRASVREAIRGLEAQGLVDVQHGQGTFVRPAEGKAGEARLSGWNRDHRYAIGELLAFRLLVEPELTAMAAEQADGAFVGSLVGIMAQMAHAAQGTRDLDALVGLDTAFHGAITGRAGNVLYRDLLDGMGQSLVDSRRISLGVPGRLALVVAGHNAIVAAVGAGDADAAWSAMRAHLGRFAADMRISPVGY